MARIHRGHSHSEVVIEIPMALGGRVAPDPSQLRSTLGTLQHSESIVLRVLFNRSPPDSNAVGSLVLHCEAATIGKTIP